MSQPLARALERLDETQAEAASYDGNMVVLAGPGSGKTATIVAKAGLLQSQLVKARGLACLTYSRDAVGEFAARLRANGVVPGRRLFLGTVHSFCLRAVIQPYASLAGHADLALPAVARASSVRSALQLALDGANVNEEAGRYASTLGRLRRARAAGESLAGFDDTDIEVADRYEAELLRQGLVDFDGMIGIALRMLADHKWIRELLVARFPWILVDEYQDLGAPLHRIVSLLLDDGAKIFAVGDPDQNIFAFSGSDPRFLQELSADVRFRVIRLPFNYRSGQRLIDVSQAALGPDIRDLYQAGPDVESRGEIYLDEAEGGFEAQAAAIATRIVPTLRDAGVPGHEIAILYRQKGALLDHIVRQLDHHGLPYQAERSEQWPRSPIVEWLQAGAEYSIRGGFGSGASFRELSDYYLGIFEDLGIAQSDRGVAKGLETLGTAFGARISHDDLLSPWLVEVVELLSLREKLSGLPEFTDDLDALETLLLKAENAGARMGDFARVARHEGRIVVTTYHGSKGREFDAVILPGLQDSLLPRSYWDRQSRTRRWADDVIVEDRRLFYVGLTRARKFAFLIWSKSFVNDYGWPDESGPSRFVREVEARLLEVDAA